MTTQRTNRLGFTFLEIMLVVLIIGILLAVAVPNITGRTQSARQAAALLSVRNAMQSIKLFEVDYGRLPTALDELMTPPTPPMGGEPRAYMEQLPRDPWRNVLVFHAQAECPDNPLSFDLYSMGPNGSDDRGEEDDIVPWYTEEEEVL